MAGDFSSSFLFCTCQVGSEPFLKVELAREHPELRLSFSRPGFLTFKRAEGDFSPDFELRSVFARTYGISLGKTKGGGEKAAGEILGKFPGLRFHAWERDRHAPGEEPKGFVPGDWARALRSSLETAGGKAAIPPQPNELVLDVVAVEEGEWWYGLHRHGGSHAPFAGGNPGVLLPADAPSRAYLKIVEALEWSGAPVREGDLAVEIGSAPGGATFALLERGLRVIGIDPGEMAPAVFQFGPGKFEHLRRQVGSVRREELPERVDWLLLDMNIEPRYALPAVERLAFRMKDCLLGVFLTLKLNQPEFADEIPAYLDYVRAQMGMARVRATQLPSNRREIHLFALSRKGLARLSGRG